MTNATITTTSAAPTIDGALLVYRCRLDINLTRKLEETASTLPNTKAIGDDARGDFFTLDFLVHNQ